MTEPTMPMPGQATHYASGEEATVIASSWMADPNPAGIYIACLLLLNQDPDYYSVVWMETDDAGEWEAKNVTTHGSIIDAVHQYEEITR